MVGGDEVRRKMGCKIQERVVEAKADGRGGPGRRHGDDRVPGKSCQHTQGQPNLQANCQVDGSMSEAGLWPCRV